MPMHLLHRIEKFLILYLKNIKAKQWNEDSDTQSCTKYIDPICIAVHFVPLKS